MADLRIAHSGHGAANSPYSIAESEGYFARHGLSVERCEVANVAASIDALADGTCQIVNAAGAAILATGLTELDAVVVMSIEARNLFGVIGAPGISKPELLRGTTLGISRFGAPDHVILRRALREWQIPFDQVGWQVLDSRGRVWSAVERGEVSAMATTIPQPILARAVGLPVLIDYAETHEPYQLGAVVTTRRFVTESRSTVTAFIAAMSDAVSRFRTDRAIALDHMTARSKLSNRAVLEQTWELFAEGMAFSRPDPQALANVARDYAVVDPAIGGVDVQSLVDRSFFPELAEQPSGGR